jgi:hypothetical protein
VENSPADRAEEPLAEEQRQPDREQQAGDDGGRDRNASEDRDPFDLVDDLADLGLDQGDVRLEQALGRVLRRADLVA